MKTLGGPWLLDRCCLLCGEAQEEHWWNLIVRRSDVDDDGASCYTASTRVIHAESSSCRKIWTCRGSSSDQHATAQVRRETPSLIDVEGLGRPKEVSGKEEDFQQWSKETEAFFAGVIKESEMMLGLAGEQATEITTTAIDLEFLLTDANVDR